MSKSLKEALKKDLDEYELQGQPEKRAYCRYLLSVAAGLSLNNKQTNTEWYVASRDRESIYREICGMTHRGENILKFETLLDNATKSFMNEYYKRPKNSISLMNVFLTMIDYYAQREQTINDKSIKAISNYLVDNFLNDNKFISFSSKNGTRKYMQDNNIASLSRRQRLILLGNEVGIRIEEYTIEQKIKAEFIEELINKWFTKKGGLKNYKSVSVKQQLLNQIDTLNLNNNQKDSLKQDLESGEISFLEDLAQRGVIDSNLIDAYKKELEPIASNDYKIK